MSPPTMSNTEPPAPSPQSPNPQPPACHHTIHAIDSNGNTTGTWVIRASTKKNQPTRRK